MRIYAMTATFGKLEQSQLTLKPGFNVIHAPNEWGKSTWCAFLMAMLYGLDTRAKTTKTALADKERYAPWSGSPMAGRIDLCWNGRDITIERSTRGRIPMGVFRAYETETGVTVEELTAANCGQKLLGVEQSVFRRAGFIRQGDLPVTQDEALFRRLNALVTTGDESGDAERLAKELRELKNRVRYNRSGLLPQAEENRDALETKINEWETLDSQSKKLRMRLEDMKQWLARLQNHRENLSFTAAQADALRVAQARDARDQAQQKMTALEHSCAKLPSREEALRKIQALDRFAERWEAVQTEAKQLPETSPQPEAEAPFQGMDPDAAVEMAQQDARSLAENRTKVPWLPLLIAGALGMLLAVGAYFWLSPAVAIAVFAAALAALVSAAAGYGRKNKRLRELTEKYTGRDPDDWIARAEAYRDAQNAYKAGLQEYRAVRADLDRRLAALETERASLCGAQSPEKVGKLWQQVLQRWEEYHAACREAEQAESHFAALNAMARQAAKPSMEDTLHYTESETAALLMEAMADQQRLQNRLGQYQGRMETLGDVALLRSLLEKEQMRIRKLEETYAALTLAQETLSRAQTELRRRFSPRISQRSQQLMQQLTDGRYQRLILGENFSLRAAAGEEETLHDALWRSDGTVDQLYLALRLAVAEELAPQAPLILDDALVRFDDRRAEAALKILKQMAQDKQVILFTCQSREKE